MQDSKNSKLLNKRINHNTSSLAASDHLSVGSRVATAKRKIENFKVKNVSQRIRKQKQVRRFQQYEFQDMQEIVSSADQLQRRRTSVNKDA